MLAKLLHQANAYPPMLVTLFGIVMLVTLLQPENALLPILVTLSGIVMLVTLLQSTNAIFIMRVVPFGIVITVLSPKYPIHVFTSPSVCITKSLSFVNLLDVFLS